MSAVKVSDYMTENWVMLFDDELNGLGVERVNFDGGNAGKYIHKIAVGSTKLSNMPLIGMISHHFEDAHLYIYGIKFSNGLPKLVSIRKVDGTSNSRLLCECRMAMGCCL